MPSATAAASSDPMASPAAADAISPFAATEAARKLWLGAKRQSDLDEVERLYRLALSSKTKQSTESNRGDPSDDTKEDGPIRKKRKSGHCGLTRDQFVKAGEKLALLLCQSGRCKKAKKGLTSMGFTCRLAKRVLDYPIPSEEGTDSTICSSEGKTKKSPLCHIVDGFLTKEEVERLQSVFISPEANYWAAHNYAVEPPSPYFSYVLPLEDIRLANDNDGARQFGFIGDLAKKIISCPIIREKFPKLGNANFVEMWAHNRPHASGHQMHFDSDDEGRGGVRNPIISTILYVSAGDATNRSDGQSTGGPSLVTNQKLSDNRLATKGWMSHPKPRRLVAFDGRYLHGVVPGKGVQEGRRVTLMLAFWEKIQIRRGLGPGSARPFPKETTMPEWAMQLVAPSDGEGGSISYEACMETAPVELDVIYETLDGKPWKRGMGMPQYDEVFQGF